jgi:hypothetical protein
LPILLDSKIVTIYRGLMLATYKLKG